MATHGKDGPAPMKAAPTSAALVPVPPGVPLAPEEWMQMSESERSAALALFAAETQETMRDITPEFPRLVTPAGGAPNWTLPSGEAVKEIEGVVIWHSKARAYWPTEAPVANNPPVCASFDGRYPASGQGPTGATQCAACPMNEWGTGKEERGKACKERLNVFVLLTGQNLPTLLSLPPTGLRPFSRYVMGLLNQRPVRPLISLTTIFGLEKKQGAQGPAYSVVAPHPGRGLTWAEIQAAVGLREKFKDAMTKRGVTEAEVVEEETADERLDDGTY